MIITSVRAQHSIKYYLCVTHELLPAYAAGASLTYVFCSIATRQLMGYIGTECRNQELLLVEESANQGDWSFQLKDLHACFMFSQKLNEINEIEQNHFECCCFDGKEEAFGG